MTTKSARNLWTAVRESITAGPKGVIEITIDGKLTSCYVE